MKAGSSVGSRIGNFILGFFFGILLSLGGIYFTARYAIKNPQVITERARDLGMEKMVEKAVEKSVQRTVASIPRDVVSVRQDDINRTVQNLTQAYSENRITPTDMQLIAGKFFGMMADQKITPQEMDELLNFMNQMAR
ncbi:hypothetical protein JW835_10745 [bacterium]|nr:hypothetical protein [bacterium]